MPVKELPLAGGTRALAATVFDLLCASYGLDRGFGGSHVVRTYDEDEPCTSAWAAKITGVPRDRIVQVAREFADNAAKTEGKSMVILGAGLNHWYHVDMSYRGIYAHTDQWRYETLRIDDILSPTAPPGDWSGTIIDFNLRAERMGWLPSATQLETNPLEIGRKLKERGADPSVAIPEVLKSGNLRLASADPENPRNWPRNMFFWRGNVLGASGKGHEYFLKHFVGSMHGVVGTDDVRAGIQRPKDIAWRDEAPIGKLDLMVNIDFRTSTTSIYSVIVLPTATWFEKHDLNTTDMHPFIHPLTAAVDPAWETKSD
jgi:nitrate reductase alpha subunit